MKIEKIKLTEIEPASYNPRVIDDVEKSKLMNSINEFGLVDPIIVNNTNNVIIGGHQRYDVLLEKGITELFKINLGDISWCFLNKELKINNKLNEKKLNIILNEVSGEWDTEKLDLLLEELELNNFDVNLTGFNNVNLSEDDYILNDDGNIKEYLIDENIVETVNDEKKYDLFKILIKVKTEKEQEKLYNKFIEEGLECQLLIL